MSGAGGRDLAVYGCVVLTALLYLNSINGGFVFDDHEAIENNIDVRTNTPLWQVFRNDFWGLQLSDPESHKSYRPLTTLSFRLNHLAHGLWSPGFHLVNILLHSLATGLYCQLLNCLGVPVSIVTTAGLLFATHPIHTEPVANIVGRTEPLSAVVYILSFLFYHYSLSHKPRPVSYSKLFLSVSILLSAVSMLCKEQGLTVLGVCVAYDLLLMCQLELSDLSVAAGSIGNLLWCKLSKSVARPSPLPRWQKSLIQRIAITSLSACVILLTRLYLNGRDSPMFIESDNPASFSESWLTRTLTYSHLVALNAWLLVCPSRLCFDWSMGSVPLIEEINDPRNISTILLLSALLLVLLWAYSGVLKAESGSLLKRRVLVSMAMIILPFLPASNLLFPVGFVLAERVLYLPSMGACLLIAIGVNKLRTKTHLLLRPLVWLLLVSTLIGYSVKTLVRNYDWRDTESLASSAVPINPGNAKVFMTLATHYTQLGQRRCELYYREALRLRPNYTAAWTNLGLVMLNTGRPVEAEASYRKALSIKADHINANINMGHLCRLQRRWSEAELYYSTALRRRPENVVVGYYRGTVLQEMGGASNVQRAIAQFSNVIQLEPAHWESHTTLAGILATTKSSGEQLQYSFSTGKRLGKALMLYERSLSLNYDQSEVHYTLSRILTSKEKREKAISHLLAVVKLSPEHLQAHLDLGDLYQQLGDPGAAVQVFQTALKLDPSSQTIKQKLELLK